MTPRLDPEGAHLAALRRLGDFRGQRVLELGCGDGRLTVGIAADASERARLRPRRRAVRASTPARYRPNSQQRVTYRVASGKEIELEPDSFDLALFSWSL